MGQVLDLDLLAPDRPYVLIRTPERPEGKPYEFRHRDEMSLKHLKRFEQTVKGLDEVDWETMTEEEVEIFERKVEDALRMVFFTEVEDEVLKGLSADKRIAILRAFFESRPETPNGRAEKAKPTTPRSRGAK